MHLNCRDRILTIGLEDKCGDLSYNVGWLRGGIYLQSAVCAIVLAHHAGYTIYDPAGTDITEHVDYEMTELSRKLLGSIW